MLRRFTRVLFGQRGQADSPCNADLDFNENEDGDDWIVVDFVADACKNRSTADREGPPRAAAFQCSSPESDMPGSPEDELFLQPGSRTLEESWLITPPACFTARCPEMVLLQHNPLEDLLIEHPSMSVYALCGSDSLRNSAQHSLQQHVCRTVPPHKRAHFPDCYVAAISAHTGSFDKAKRRCLAQRIKTKGKKPRLSLNSVHRFSPGKPREKQLMAHQPAQRWPLLPGDDTHMYPPSLTSLSANASHCPQVLGWKNGNTTNHCGIQ